MLENGEAKEKEGSVVSACVFPEKEPVGRRLENGGREREKSGKKRGGDASITLEKRKRRFVEKELADRGEMRRRRRGKRQLGWLGRERNGKIDRWIQRGEEKARGEEKETAGGIEPGRRYRKERGKRGGCLSLSPG